MSVRIQLDNPPEHYTNLDYISGNVILSCPHEETVTAIIVKLEGESQTQLLRPPQPNEHRDRDRMCRENHKILYKIAQVFPKGENTNSIDNAMLGVGMNYTLPPGQHIWPFRFRLPVNNGCASAGMQGVGAGYSFGGLRLGELPGQMAYRHITKTLPPTLTGSPNEAEIRYFVKATVQRPGIWRENRRTHLPFRFLPIEPPRPPLTAQETYARRSHTFAKAPAAHTIKRKPSLFTTKIETTKSGLSETPPSITVDARLPNPAILTCRKPIPLRLLVKKQNESPECVYLTNLQVELISFTQIRAQDLERTSQAAWIILTKANLNIPISKPQDPIGMEMVVDGSGLWDILPVPIGVLPSFQTCNITRLYHLEVKVGLGYGSADGNVQPQSLVQLPLRFPVQVFSGIPPPEELLHGKRPQSQPTTPVTPQRPPDLPARPAQNGHAHAGPSYDPAYPPQLRPDDEGDDAPPPSYEDAIAEGASNLSLGIGTNGTNGTGTGTGTGGTAMAGSSTAGNGSQAFQSRVDSKG